MHPWFLNMNFPRFYSTMSQPPIIRKSPYDHQRSPKTEANSMGLLWIHNLWPVNIWYPPKINFCFLFMSLLQEYMIHCWTSPEQVLQEATARHFTQEPDFLPRNFAAWAVPWTRGPWSFCRWIYIYIVCQIWRKRLCKHAQLVHYLWVIFCRISNHFVNLNHLKISNL